MDTITIRQAGECDREALEALIANCYMHIYPDWYDEDTLEEAMPIMLRIDPALLASGNYLAAHVGGELAGCGGWSKAAPGSTPNEVATGHIRHFATRPGLMRQGVGRTIIRACIDAAREAGLEKLKCFSSLPAERFYARSGFKRIAEVTVMLGESAPLATVLMEMEL